MGESSLWFLPEMTRPAFRIGTQVFFLTRLGKLYRAEHCLPKMPVQIQQEEEESMEFFVGGASFLSHGSSC